VHGRSSSESSVTESRVGETIPAVNLGPGFLAVSLTDLASLRAGAAGSAERS
jgi:hypothetical protein